MLCCFWIFELFTVREHIPFVLVRSFTVYIYTTLLGWCSFWASLLLFYKNQFPADSLSPPFSLWSKISKSWDQIWNWLMDILICCARWRLEKWKSCCRPLNHQGYAGRFRPIPISTSSSTTISIKSKGCIMVYRSTSFWLIQSKYQ